jgi:hypothetical protein
MPGLLRLPRTSAAVAAAQREAAVTLPQPPPAAPVAAMEAVAAAVAQVVVAAAVEEVVAEEVAARRRVRRLTFAHRHGCGGVGCSDVHSRFCCGRPGSQLNTRPVPIAAITPLFRTHVELV